MREVQALVVDTLAATVDELCQKFGVRKTACALILAMWRRHQMKNQLSHLSNRMRRDIGLADSREAPIFRIWNIRAL
ncbi:DUF1127 domain-containing protein [Phyllobacterium sophorae]|uniref:DUF1127 domain-containing protein n=1 Tax=Phyllobacterium sophorae TaxID=1520277 RepID=A0A2P7B5R4_9HYPH|nr:DUF1127 domain-containing protein [Phyllobacterium sophorae]PSH61793.1 DUF1127 domain-containing protein [Phyllobacterium sophorae]